MEDVCGDCVRDGDMRLKYFGRPYVDDSVSGLMVFKELVQASVCGCVCVCV